MKKIILVIAFVSVLFSSSCEDTLLNLKIEKNNVKLSSIIKGFADECGYSIFYENGGEEVEKKIVSKLNFQNEPVSKIFEFLFNKYNFHYGFEDNILVISKIKTKTIKVDYLDTLRKNTSNTEISIAGTASSSSDSDTSGSNIQTEENFDFWGTLEAELALIVNRPEDVESPESNIVVNKKGGFITITGTKKQLDRTEKYIDKLLETLKKQVVIDVKIISVNLDNSYKTGIDWTKLSAGFNSSGVSSESQTSGSSLTTAGISTATAAIPGTNSWIVGQSYFDGNAFISFLKGFGETKSLSNPKIMAMNNQPTMISIGDNINYLKTTANATESGSEQESTEAKDIFIGVLLDITPQIDDNGFVTLRINPSISEFKYTEDAQKQVSTRVLPPDTVSRRISTVVRVKDSDVIILGGLISSSKANTENKVPLLGDIPYMGRLFKSNSITDITTEIVFVLTPRIVSNEKSISLKDLGYFSLEEKDIQ